MLAFKHLDDATAQVEIVSLGQAASNAIRPLARPFGSYSVNKVALPENEPVNSQEVLNLVAVRTAFLNRAARYCRQNGGRLEDVFGNEPLEPFTQSLVQLYATPAAATATATGSRLFELLPGKPLLVLSLLQPVIAATPGTCTY